MNSPKRNSNGVGLDLLKEMIDENERELLKTIQSKNHDRLIDLLNQRAVLKDTLIEILEAKAG
jgi:hypothetical protein